MEIIRAEPTITLLRRRGIILRQQVVTSIHWSNKLYGSSILTRSDMCIMTGCKCEKEEHHKEMNRAEQIAHLESCMAEIIHRLECIKDELSGLRTH